MNSILKEELTRVWCKFLGYMVVMGLGIISAIISLPLIFYFKLENSLWIIVSVLLTVGLSFWVNKRLKLR